MINVKCVKLEDGLDYAVLDEIDCGNITYVYLTNIKDENDFCIRKIDNNKNEELLIGLNSNEEFDKALLLFTKKHNSRM